MGIKTKKIFNFIIMATLSVIGFFFGDIYEQNTHTEETNRNWNTIEQLQAQVDQDTWTRDYNALMNIKFVETVNNSTCTSVQEKFTAIQNEFDSLMRYDGQLVVPKAEPEPK